MTTKRQHYVPQVYLKAWETPTFSKKGPQNISRCVYYFEKGNLEVGEKRNKDSILYEPRIYYVDFEIFTILRSCPIITKDFTNQIIKKLEERKVIPYLNGKPLTMKELPSYFDEIDKWEFKYKESPSHLASKKAIINDIKQTTSYVLEHAIDDALEKNWEKSLNKFISEMENTIPLNGIDEVREINENTVFEIVKNVFFLICRNPNFDYMGILPVVLGSLSTGLSEVIGSDKTEKLLNMQKKAIWLKEIYNGLFNVSDGYLYRMKQIAEKHLQIMLYKCEHGQGTFITSDTPAFQHISFLEATNLNSIICPLTPQYILLLMKGKNHSLRDVNFRKADNKLIRRLNSFVLNNSNKSIVASCKYLGYIL